MNKQFDNRTKRQYFDKLIYDCKFGVYKSLRIKEPVKYYYDDDYNIPPPYEYCITSITENHPIDISCKYVKMGQKPIMVNFVENTFTSNSNMSISENMHDPVINMRTNFFQTLLFASGEQVYPITEHETVNTNVNVLRNASMSNLSLQDVVPINIITSILPSIDIKESNNYEIVSNIFEAIFQTACNYSFDTLILNDMGIKTKKYDVGMVCDMINTNIYKYGHLFKNLDIGYTITSHSDKGCFAYLSKHLVYPQKYIIEYIEKNHN